MKTGITPAVTHKKSWIFFFLLVEMVQNFMGTIFRTKITTNNFFMTKSKKFVILSRKKKKSIKIFWKMTKNVKIFKIQMWVSGRNRPIFGRKVADRVRSSQNSGQNFFYGQISKIGDFIQESRLPPPPVFAKNGGGGSEVIWNLSQISFKLVTKKNDPVKRTFEKTLTLRKKNISCEKLR